MKKLILIIGLLLNIVCLASPPYTPITVNKTGTVINTNNQFSLTNNLSLGNGATISDSGGVFIDGPLATNSFDAINSAKNATNGYPWLILSDPINSAKNSTNNGNIVFTNNTTWFDSINSAKNSTNGFIWGSLYDNVNSAFNATNGYPWGSLYDNVNSAFNATNGYPWGSLYDSVNSAKNATNNLGSGAFAYIASSTNNAITVNSSGYVQNNVNLTLSNNISVLGQVYENLASSTNYASTNLNLSSGAIILAVSATINLQSGMSPEFIYTTNASFTISSFVPNTTPSSIYMMVSNSSASSITATISAAYRPFGATLATNALVIPAGQFGWIYVECPNSSNTNMSNTVQ